MTELGKTCDFVTGTDQVTKALNEALIIWRRNGYPKRLIPELDRYPLNWTQILRLGGRISPVCLEQFPNK